MIISKNEEKNIAKCIESVLEGTKEISDKEIILVDSASTDKTIEIAKQYPVKIISEYQSSSPGAGRYIGTSYCNGKYILFIDGDSTLDKNWVKKSIPVLEKRKMIAGVAGLRTQSYYENNEKHKSKGKKITSSIEYQTGIVESLGGPATFKMEVLKKVGSYNPYIRGEEEAELCFRIRNAGYKLLRLSVPMTLDLGRKSGMSEYINRAKFSIGIGQNIRYSFGKRYFKDVLKKYRYSIVFSLWSLGHIIIPIFSIIFYFLIIPEFIYLIHLLLIFDCLSFIVILSRKRNFKQSVYSFLGFLLKGFAVVRGLLRTPKNINSYPINVRVIK